MSIAVLYPPFDHHAIEERVASQQSQLRLRAGREHSRIVFYDPYESSADVMTEIEETHVLVVLDPLVVTSAGIGVRLREVVEMTQAAAALPVTNEAKNPSQRFSTSPYLTLRELEDVFARLESEPLAFQRVVWDDSNPAIFLCRSENLRRIRQPMRHALRGHDVAVTSTTYVHDWSSLRGNTRDDLLPHIPLEARSLLELGCGEGGLGALIKQRQRCRVVGVEIDHDAATVARRRIDDVYTGDVRHIIEIIHEQFDCIVASELVEHIDDPWSFLEELRRLSAPGGRLVTSIPNIANASIVNDLLNGRFDYAYIGLTCAGHLRFFTSKTIEELLITAGWRVESIIPQVAAVTPAGEGLLRSLQTAGLPFSDDQLRATGYYAIARNGHK